MAQGTLTLTNNSADVTGQGTSFLTDIKEGDFLLASVAGLSYFLNVKTITSDTALTLTAPYIGETASSVGFDVIPKESLVNVPSGLIYESSRALRAQNLDKENWQKVFSVDDDITVTLIDGSQYTGISWLKASKGISSANVEAVTALAEQISQDASSADNSASQAAASSSAAQSAQSAAEAARDKAQTAQSAAEASETAADKSASAAATSETNAASANSSAQSAKDSATASASAASKSETNAASAASAAKQSETNAANSASSANTADTSAQAAQKAAETAQAAAESANSTAQTAMSSASDSATAAAASAKAAATSETNAAASSETAQAAQDGVAASAAAAAQSETNASNSEKAASASETAAANSAESASSASSAASAAQKAAEAAQAAAESANATAQTAQTNASNSAAAAAASESAAGKSAEDAASSSETAQAAQSVVAASAEAAAQSESNAKSSESAAASSQAAAETAASQASTANTSALAAQSAAEAAQAAAESANDTAQTAQTNASSSAQSASDSADTATAQATEAGNQADLAKQYADSLNADLLMAKANNLSDVADLAEARENLSLDKVVQTSASTNLNYPTKNAAFVLRDSDLTWGVYNNDSAAWSPLGIGQGGTGATNADAGLKNLSGFYFRGGTGLTEDLNSLTGSKAGLYYCPANSQATTSLNYPIASAGTLLVMKTGANSSEGCLQYYYPYNGLSPYFRKYDGTWGNWGQLVQTGDYGVGGNGTFTPTGIYNGFISESDGNTTWGAVNGGGWQSNYANTRLFQMMISTSNDTYTRYVDSGDPKASKTSYPWTRLLKQGSYGIGIDLATDANLQVNLNTLGTSVSGFYYTTNESSLGGITSDATYVLVNRGSRPTCTAYKYVQQRSWDGFYMGTTGWTWKEKAYMSAVNEGRFTVQTNGEAIRLIQPSGGACYIMGYYDNSGSTAQRRWYIGNGGSDNTAVFYNSKVGNSFGLANLGNVYIQTNNSGSTTTTQFQTNGTIVGPQGTVQQVSSDESLKYDIADAQEGALERINAIQCKEFNWKHDDRRDRGFIAQQLQEVDPLYTFMVSDCSYLNYSLPGLLSDVFGAIQELTSIKDNQTAQIDNMKASLTEQQSQIDELKAIVAQLLGSSSDQVAGS